jgi:excisionase family DNA binding protein
MAPKREIVSVSPFATIAATLEQLAHVPERLEAIEQQLAQLHPSGAKELLTVKEVEEQWGISDTKLYQLIHRGEIRAIKIDRSTRVPLRELRRWLDSKIEEE